MTILGWVFLASSLSWVWGLTGWCFYKVLTAEDAPPEPAPHVDRA